jgi:hypothetical protein
MSTCNGSTTCSCTCTVCTANNNNCCSCPTSQFTSCCDNGTQGCPEVEEVQHCPPTSEISTAVLTTACSFNIPACSTPGQEQCVEIIVTEDISKGFPDNTHFYFGKLRLIYKGIDAEKNIIRAYNPCLSCDTAQVGENIPAQTRFIAFPPECFTGGGGGGGTTPFLCTDLIVPAVGMTVTVNVTTTSGITLNDIVDIGGSRFQVVSIPTTTQLELQNNGEGGTPGSTIDAGDNCDTVPIIVISGETPCEQDPVTDLDQVVGCKNDELRKIDMNEGEVLGKSGGQIKGILLNIPEQVCTTFQGCLLLNPALNPQEYPLIVDDATGFQLGDIVFFDCDEDDPKRQFEITDINGTTFTLVPFNFTVTELETIADDCNGCKLVKGECCLRLENIIQCIKDLIIPPMSQSERIEGDYLAAPPELPNNAAFPGDPTSQVYIDDTGEAVEGLPTANDLYQFDIVNNTDCDWLWEFNVVMNMSWIRISNGGRWNMELALSDNAFAGFDFSSGLLGQAGPFLAQNTNFIDNDVAATPNPWGESRYVLADGDPNVIIPAQSTKTIHVLARITTVNTGTSNASRIDNMPVRIRGTLFPQCAVGS